MEQKYQQAFLEAYDEYADTVFRLCYGKTGSREEAKDMTQETFVRVWQRLCTPTGTRKPWVPDEGQGFRVPDEGQGFRVPDEGQGFRVPDEGQGFRVPDEGQRLQKEQPEIKNLRAFLFTVARNIIKDYYKKKKPILEHDLPEGTLERTPAPQTHFGIGAEYTLALKALARLPDDYREAITLHLIEGLPIGDVAEMLGERPNTISVRVKRALQKLRIEMKLDTP